MTRKYFGTDGIRGQANCYPMTADMALKVAMATAQVLRREELGGDHKNRAVIGKDPRLSGYMLEQAMTAGFLAMGMDVFLTGPMPTPAIARLTRTWRADVGVMISASHNSYQDNGIKLFGADGYKLPDAMEQEIESWIDRDMTPELPGPEALGKATRIDDAQGRYVEFVKRSFPRGQTLEGMKVVLDCANGAAYKVAPQLLWELEAEVITIGDKPNGRNINDRCGATAPAQLQERVLAEGADIGIALDGDADRLIVVDEKGIVVDGDQIMALLAVTKKAQGFLQGNGIVATVMSNLGLERFLQAQGMDLVRTAVGDRYVIEAMRAGGYNIGGEQSGHLILSDFSTTGDGVLAALQVLAAIKQAGKPASAVLHLFDSLPQILQNVRFENGAQPLDDAGVKDAITQAEQTLANDGRLVIRPSGTEPVIRVMAEGDDQALVQQIVNDLCAVIEKAAG
ncbi:MAG: phosphoglucosamine mutase [Rhodospirillales bacterium]|nr:phosphoglucosamine mutase [Rhodospirillales bacterium]MCB9994977.1 phosphoglucosamine mutase [Rhodospirillales bacterium]